MSTTSKFEFDIEFQWEIIKFLILDAKGTKAIQLIEDRYFALISQQVIIYTLKKFYNKRGRLPKNSVNFKSELKSVFKLKKYAQALKEEDRVDILKSANRLFKGVIKDGDIIYENCKKFASFVQVKNVLENFDITNYSGYEAAINKLQRATTVGIELEEETGEFIFLNMANRQFKRKYSIGVIPTPFRQLNAITNAGGFEPGSIITIIDTAKSGKTAALVNIGRGYTRQRKRVIVFDFENGVGGYATRYEQSLVKASKSEILSGKYDQKLQKLARKYIRLGCEVVIHRLPSGSTTADLDRVMTRYKSNGYSFKVGIIDYIGLMGCLAGDTDDTSRISKAYIDVKNWALKWELDIVYTGHHVLRDGYKRKSTKYESTDTAKCIDINRHVDAMFGINQNEEEKEAGVVRFEVVDIRDGLPDARAFFWFDINIQRLDEFTKDQLSEYYRQNGNSIKKEKAKTKSLKGTNTDMI